jgi:hypothetical protein
LTLKKHFLFVYATILKEISLIVIVLLNFAIKN